MNEDDRRLMLSAQTKVASSEIQVWLWLGSAVFFAAVAAWFGIHADLHQRGNWVSFFIVCFIAASSGYFSAMSWLAAAHARSLLAQLQAEQTKTAALPPGVWPPPPSRP